MNERTMSVIEFYKKWGGRRNPMHITDPMWDEWTADLWALVWYGSLRMAKQLGGVCDESAPVAAKRRLQ